MYRWSQGSVRPDTQKATHSNHVTVVCFFVNPVYITVCFCLYSVWIFQLTKNIKVVHNNGIPMSETCVHCIMLKSG
jgi:hypothetical protein